MHIPIRTAAATSGLICAAVAPTALAGGAIDFELVGGMTPTDGMQISNQFEAEFGVSFSLEGGGFPVLAEVGPPRTAFDGHQGNADQPAPGVEVGQFFLTDDGTLSGVPDPLIVDYSTPVSAASGVILDVDFSERWTIEAYNASGTLLATDVLTNTSFGAGNALDAPWSISVQAPVIKQIIIRYTGSGGTIGLAFDNFSPATAGPPPLCQADLNGDGRVDGIDLSVVLGGWGECDFGKKPE